MSARANCVESKSELVRQTFLSVVTGAGHGQMMSDRTT